MLEGAEKRYSEVQMTAPRKDSLTAHPPLLQAALAGLLSLSASACHYEKSPPSGPGEITSQRNIGKLDEAGFQAMCDERGGKVEGIAHCGGLASAAGFAYDITTEELSEHTCKGANTCTGWNCIIEG
jgi:hypothetical protein